MNDKREDLEETPDQDFEALAKARHAEQQAPKKSLEVRAIEEHGRIGKYRVVEELGKGGMGGVYLVEDDHSRFIMKVPLTEDQRPALENEIRVLDKVWQGIEEKLFMRELLLPPNIINLIDSSTDEFAYAVLELLEGEIKRKKSDSGRIVRSLTDDPGNVQSTRVALYIWDVMHALEVMHSMDIVHRDVKHTNCMDTNKRGKLGIVLFDFGLALDLTDQEEVRSQSGRMTPYYLTKDFAREYLRYKGRFYQDCNPERMNGILKRRDFGALALSAAHLLTNVHPYSHTDRAKVDGVHQHPFSKGRNMNDYLLAIRTFKGSPIDFRMIQEKMHGDMFGYVFEQLLSPNVVDPKQRKKVYRALEKGMNIPGFFTKYRA